MKSTIIIILGTACTVSVFAQDLKQVTTSQYSFSYPASWDLQFRTDSKDGFNLYLPNNPSRKRNGINLRVSHSSNQTIDSLWLWHERGLAKMKERLQEWESDSSVAIIRPSDNNRSCSTHQIREGKSGSYIIEICTFTSKNGKFKNRSQTWIENNQRYILQARFREDVYQKNQEAIEAIFNSFRPNST